MTQASERMQRYFAGIKEDVFAAYELAKRARAQGYDPASVVEVELAETLAERVVGLMSVIAPQIKNAGIEMRIEELERQYGILDWRVAFVIAHEIAQQKYCAFDTQLQAIEVGVKVGFAYVTLGVVSSPIEGLTTIEIKPRQDGKGEYFRLNYAGPIRNAGGTMASVSVLIADYVRVRMGYATYDPTEKEILRCPAELEDYHQFIANLQYFPSKEESIFLMRHLPVEIAGDGSEYREISNVNLKDLPRIETNNLRSGYCLIHSSCIPLKAPKLWAKLEKWGEQMGMGHWSFLKEFLDLQKKIKAKGKKEESAKITPDYTYIKDLVAGRPVFAHPLRPGGLRLRYGRSRASGYSGQAIHPATMVVLDDFIASATQIKVERPGKAAAFMPCDSIDGPIVKLFDGTVIQLHTEEEARRVRRKIQEILFMGDVLVNYGDFFDRAHTLVPPGYCPEFWMKEVYAALEGREAPENTVAWLARAADLPHERLASFLQEWWRSSPTYDESLRISRVLGVPLHPAHTYYWTVLSPAQLFDVLALLQKSTYYEQEGKLLLPLDEKKRLLELVGLPHERTTEHVLVKGDAAKALLGLFGYEDVQNPQRRRPYDCAHHEEILAKFTESEGRPILERINLVSEVPQRDKAGIFIGSRMGRPEKAKMRKLTGSPHTLFPIGEEGGRLRSFQAALEVGKVRSACPVRTCTVCNIETPLSRCELCDAPTRQETVRPRMNDEVVEQDWKEWEIPIQRIFDGILKKLDLAIYPDLIKGVRGTSNRSHIPEHPAKGILRARHDVHVNKDGTIRYDASEVTLTHFKPREVRTTIERLHELGYDIDVEGKPLVNEDQVLELKPQDVVLPCCDAPGYPDERCDEVLFRAANYVDDLLQRLYKIEQFYKLSSKEDLIGQYIIGLAPHTSAGIVGRIVGFSRTQGFLAHPLFHAAMRRDCDGDESSFLLMMDAFLNFSRKYLPDSRGGTMDAPLVLTYFLNPAEVDDMAFNVDTVWEYPLEFYQACLDYKKPWEVPIKRLGDLLGKPEQFEGMGFTHPVTDLNAGVLCSSYKTLPSMEEKLNSALLLAKRLRGCDASDVARLVITKHFMRDTKGNLRKFSQQQFRCVNCNEKYRRPPLRGNCKICNGKIIFTISKGSVVKYLELSIRIAEEYNVPTYVKQDLELTKRRVEDTFGKDPERQENLQKFLSA